MASPASYQVLLLFTPTSTYDVTGDVEELSFDRSLATFSQHLQVGQGQLRLHNIYGRYTPGNTDSDLAIRPGLSVQVTGVASGTSATRLFTGTIDAIGVDVALDSPRSSIWSLSDFSKPMTLNRAHTQIHSGTCVGSLFSAAFTSLGITTAQQSIETIADTRRWVTLGYEEHAIDDLHDLICSGPYTVNIGRDGNVAVWHRYHHNSASAVNTYTSMWALTYGLGDEVVFNRVTATNHYAYDEGYDEANGGIYGADDEDESVLVPASGWASIERLYGDEGQDDADVVWSNRDGGVNSFHADDQPDGGGTGRTATTSYNITFYGTSWVATFFNGIGTDVYVDVWGLYAHYVIVEDEATYIRDNTVSQSLYGVQNIEFDLLTLARSSAGRSMAAYINSVYGTPAVEFSATFRNEYPYALTEDVGSNISVVNTLAGINNKFTIMSSRTRITAGPDGWVHENEYDLREASKV